ncbi:MAG: hypothetical protein OEY63_03760, partial [Gemmatimonadota bacterium]|nr:hypothetical protein [Gemmatimonadota bacterium]
MTLIRKISTHLILLQGAMLLSAAPSGAQGFPGRIAEWSPDDRVAIGSFQTVEEVVLTDAGLFVIAESGIAIYDLMFDLWHPPVTALEGWSVLGIVAAIGDPADQSLWVAGRSDIFHYLPVLREVRRIAVPQGVGGLAFD